MQFSMAWQRWEPQWGASGSQGGRQASGGWHSGRAARRGRRRASGPAAKGLEEQVRDLTEETAKLKAQLAEAAKARATSKAPEDPGRASSPQTGADAEALRGEIRSLESMIAAASFESHRKMLQERLEHCRLELSAQKPAHVRLKEASARLDRARAREEKARGEFETARDTYSEAMGKTATAEAQLAAVRAEVSKAGADGGPPPQAAITPELHRVLVQLAEAASRGSGVLNVSLQPAEVQEVIKAALSPPREPAPETPTYADVAKRRRATPVPGDMSDDDLSELEPLDFGQRLAQAAAAPPAAQPGEPDPTQRAPGPASVQMDIRSFGRACPY